MAKLITARRLSAYWPLYFFVLPSAVLVATFSYYPAVNAMYHAFFRWNGDYIKYYIGAENFRRALGAPVWWVAALVLSALNIYLGGRRSGFTRAVQALAGIVAPLAAAGVAWRAAGGWKPPAAWTAPLAPLIVWGGWLVGALIWGDRENPNRPVLLAIPATLLVGGLASALGAPAIAAWGAALAGLGVLTHTLPALTRAERADGFRIAQALSSMAVVAWALAAHAGGDATLWRGFVVTIILIVANIVKMIPSIATAVVIHRLRSQKANYWYRVLFVVPMIIPGMVTLLIWKFFFEPNGVFNLVLRRTGVMTLLVNLDRWLGWGGVFQPDTNPVWLGSPHLVLPAMILWGFPWVGVVGVLIYLAGLQSIDQSVYEAADLDGISPFGKFLHIELPLILTQVRINLVLMIIGTLQAYAFVLILFGDAGGPNGVLMVPGLYMFRSAFIERYVGYACAIGLILFFFILILTEINNRFLRVEK